MSIIHTENHHANVNMLDELEIKRAVTLPNILNEVNSDKNDSFLKLFL